MEALAIVHNKSANSPEAAAAFANQDIFYQLRISPYLSSWPASTLSTRLRSKR